MVSSLQPLETFSSPAIARKRLPFDGGNRFLKWIDPKGKARIIPSCIKELEDWEDAQPDDRSVLIEIEGERYVIGQVAQDLGGQPVFEQDKCELAWLLALAAIEPNPGCSTVLIEQMLVALPDSRKKDAVAHIREIEGTRDFYRNGIGIVATVREVVPVDETEPAYRYAVARQMFKHPKRINGILDLGGGTGIGRLYSPNGTMIRSADMILPGTFQLASKIAVALTPQLGYSPNLRSIMDGIADDTFELGTTGTNYHQIFLKCRDSWIGDIRARLKTAWVQQLNDLAEVLIIGGSAGLAQPLSEVTKGRFKVATHPQVSNFSQFVSLYGMAME